MLSSSSGVKEPRITLSPEEKESLLADLDAQGRVGSCTFVLFFSVQIPPYSEK